MNKYLIIFSITLFFGCVNYNTQSSSAKSASVNSQEQKQEKVALKVDLNESFKEFKDTLLLENIADLQAGIKSNRLIKIKTGTHLIEKTIRIGNCENLMLVGKPGTKILLTDPASQTLNIIGSNTVGLKNIFWGHKISPLGSCEQGVVGINNSKNILIDACVLDGSGLHGLNINGLQNLLFTNSTIQNCTNSIIDCQGCEDLKFESSQFTSNFCYDHCFRFYGEKSQQIYFRNAAITNNQGESGDEMGLLLFPHGFKAVTIETSVIAGNKEMGVGLDQHQLINTQIVD